MKPLSVTFLGTCSGGGPLLSRACSSTMINLEQSHWLVDCAEGTQLQIKRTATFKPEHISKIFVTHMHIDHVMGLIPLMRTAMNKTDAGSTRLRMQFYGPPGLRQFVRMNLELTQTQLGGRYAVHELLGPNDQPSAACDEDLLHPNEKAGADIRPDEEGLWRSVTTEREWTVHAGPIKHRVPCIGYVFQEQDGYTYRPEDYIPHIERNAQHLQTESRQGGQLQEWILRRVIGRREVFTLPDGTVLDPPPLDIPGRKLAILGDTWDPTAITSLCMDASLLIHEATQAAVPVDLAKRVPQLRGPSSEQQARKSAIKNGHSTAAMAGEFARDIRARRLYLNHFSIKLSLFGSRDKPHERDRGPPGQHHHRKRYNVLDEIMQETERQASDAWGLGTAIAAYDLLTVPIPTHEVPTMEGPSAPHLSMDVVPSETS